MDKKRVTQQLKELAKQCMECKEQTELGRKDPGMSDNLNKKAEGQWKRNLKSNEDLMRALSQEDKDFLNRGIDDFNSDNLRNYEKLLRTLFTINEKYGEKGKFSPEKFAA